MCFVSNTLCDRSHLGPRTCACLAGHADVEASEESLLTRYVAGKGRNIILIVFLVLADILLDSTLKLDKWITSKGQLQYAI